MTRLIRTLVLPVLLVQSTYGAGLTNGSFEQPGNVPVDSYIGFSAGSTSLVGWTIGSTNAPFSGITYHHRYHHPEMDFLPVDGEYAIIFNGGDHPADVWISQDFNTVPGADYEVSFYVGRLGLGADPVSLTATVLSGSGEVLQSLVAVPPVHGYGNKQKLVFQAVSSVSTLKFTDTSSEAKSVDVALDHVSVVPLAVEVAIYVSQVNICWDSLADRMYQVQVSYLEPVPKWDDLGEPVAGNGERVCVSDSVGTEGRRLYRVLTLP